LSNPPLVSIVLATYNGAKYLAAQLDSLLNQTYGYTEIIICDDASTDNTQTIIKDYAEKNNNISYYFHVTNIGVNKNFEFGFLKAKGNFIAVADQDDIWLPHKIETQLKLFTTNNVVLTHSTSIRFTGDKIPTKTVKKITHLFEGNDVRKLILRNSVSGHNIIFKTALLQQLLPIPSNIYYDWWLVQTAACNGFVAATNNVLAYQRAHEQNVTIKKRHTVFQTKAEYEERKNALQAFLKLKGLEKLDYEFINQTFEHFLTLENKTFSLSLYKYLLKNRKILFYYKKGLITFFSQRKAAKRMSYKISI
jgi:glycosyltransferase involved in cell wall biosynthesis